MSEAIRSEVVKPRVFRGTLAWCVEVTETVADNPKSPESPKTEETEYAVELLPPNYD